MTPAGLVRPLAAGAPIALLIGQAVDAIEAERPLASGLWFAAIVAVALGYGVVAMRLARRRG